MKEMENCEVRTLKLPDLNMTYRVYRHPQAQGERRLVLVHGAGVAGRDTWQAVQHYLDQWHEILVPDMRGTGDTWAPDGKEHPFTVQHLVHDLAQLVDQLGWWQFDLGGYSLGGLVSMLFKQMYPQRVEKQYLLEPGGLDRVDFDATIQLREAYSDAAQHLRGEDVENGVRQFLNTIAPNRKTSEQTDRMAINRLAYRPEGFANCLDAVTSAIRTINRKELVAAQGDVSSFIGGLSVEQMHVLHRQLAERMPNWHYFLIPGTDHSLPYQKPRQIARIMNAELERFLA